MSFQLHNAQVYGGCAPGNCKEVHCYPFMYLSTCMYIIMIAQKRETEELSGNFYFLDNESFSLLCSIVHSVPTDSRHPPI